MKLDFLLHHKCMGIKDMTSLIYVKAPTVLSIFAFASSVQMSTVNTAKKSWYYYKDIFDLLNHYGRVLGNPRSPGVIISEPLIWVTTGNNKLVVLNTSEASWV